MKKYIFFFAAAAALVACSKNEVTPAFSNENTEIAYNVAPKTKALTGTQSDFDHGNVFTSYAYYLAPGKTWDNDFEESKPYIEASEISYVGDLWKNQHKTYYWPKDGGSLTFFSYSLNKGNMDFSDGQSGMGVSVTKGNDGSFTGGVNGAFDIQRLKNVDFLVADVAKDQTQNVATYAHQGVPTLFRHKLSMVQFTAKLQEHYDSKTFTVNNIQFLKLDHYASYSQFPEKWSTLPANAIDQQYAVNAKQVINENTRDVITPVINNEEGVKQDEGQYIYLPHVFGDDDYLQIDYTVTTLVGTKSVVENCTEKIQVNKIFKQWEIGKKYVFDITFSLNEIHWDPAVEDWTTETAGSITIDK